MGITKPGAGRKVTDEDGCAEHQGKLNADAFPLKVGVKYRMAHPRPCKRTQSFPERER